jgi:hypothetical protein
MRLLVLTAPGLKDAELIHQIMEKHTYAQNAADIIMYHTGAEDICIKYAEKRAWDVRSCKNWNNAKSAQPFRQMLATADPDYILGFVTKYNTEPVDSILKIAKAKKINYAKYLV